MSVLLAAHNADQTLARAIESVISQPFEDLELVIVDCASTDRTASICERAHDRDIRVECVTCESESLFDGLHEAGKRVRGTYVFPMRAQDWLGTDALGPIISFAREHDLDLAVPAQSFDTYTAGGQDRRSSVTSFGTTAWESAADFHRAVGELVSLGVLDDVFGVLIKTDDVRALIDREAAPAPFDVVLHCLNAIERAGVFGDSCYHVTLDTDRNVAFDPNRYLGCEASHAKLMELFEAWGYSVDDKSLEPLYHRYVMDIIRCIDNACIGRSSVSSMERTQRVQDMIDASATQRALQMVEHAAREFGCMYRPMARRNAAACCMGSRLREAARISHIPLGPQL